MQRRREWAVELMLKLPAEKLEYVERLLADLECGDESPLWSDCQQFDASSPFIAPESGDESPHSKLKSGDESPHPKGGKNPVERDWPHAPLHRLSTYGTFIVTAGTLHKHHLFKGAKRLDLLEKELLGLAKQYGWQLEAWAVFSNHYHFVAHAGEQAKDLRELLKHLHGKTARELNRMDNIQGRTVWHNFWDTELTYERSYLARLNYVHQNAVKHGLVPVANQYRWCSAAWFERTATRAQVKTIYSFKIDKVRVQRRLRSCLNLGVRRFIAAFNGGVMRCGFQSLVGTK